MDPFEGLLCLCRGKHIAEVVNIFVNLAGEIDVANLKDDVVKKLPRYFSIPSRTYGVKDT